MGLRLLSTAAIAVFTVGCGSSVSIEDFDDELEDRLCRAAVECGTMPDLETCLAVTGTFDTSQIEADQENGLIDYNGDAADSCIDALVSALASCELNTTGEGFDIDDACDAVISGKVPLGGDCREDEHCEGVASCDKSCFEACCLGTCVAENPDPPDADIGQNCSEADCVSAAYCDESGTVPTCTARVALDGACTQFNACVSGAFCDLDFTTQMGTCVALPDQGEACDPEAFVSFCKRVDNFCDPVSSTCIQRRPPGEACDTSAECIQWSYCSTMSTCIAKPTEGQACDDVTIECLGDLECTSGSCAFDPADPICTDPI